MRSRYEEDPFASYLAKADFRNQSVIGSRPVTVVSSSIHTCHTSIQTHTSRMVSTSSEEYESSEPSSPSPTSSVACRYDTLNIEDLDIIKTIGKHQVSF